MLCAGREQLCSRKRLCARCPGLAVLQAVLRAMLLGRWLLPGASLALGAGLGAALTARWQRGAGGTEVAEGLLGRLPVVPVVAAAAAGPPVPTEPARTELTKYGLPGLAQLRSRESYVLCYDPRSRSALWVVEQLNRETLSGSSDRTACDFQEDDSVHEYHRATNADYRGSGFDRGHLAAAANHKWSQKAMRDTFYLSNVAPQVCSAARVAHNACVALMGSVPTCVRVGVSSAHSALSAPGMLQMCWNGNSEQ